MSEPEVSGEPAAAERKLFGKHKWRGKFFSHEEKSSKPQELADQPGNDVIEFLATSNNRKISDQASVSRTSGTFGRPSVSTIDSESPQHIEQPRRKAPRRPGLHVTFSSAPPDIIGEGGDESDLPSIDIAKSRARAMSWRQSRETASNRHARRGSPPPHDGSALAEESIRGSQDDNASGPPQLHRRLPDVQQANNSTNLYVGPRAPGDKTASSGETQSLLPSPDIESDSEALAATYMGYIQASPVSPQVVVDESSPQSVRDRLPHKREVDDLRALSRRPSDFQTLTANSLTPFASPQPPRSREASPSGYGFPATGPPKKSSSSSEVMNQTVHATTQPVSPEVSPSAIHSTSRRPPLLNSSSSSSPLKTPPISLRTVAKNLGGDALNDFTSRVQRFYGIFRLGAFANKSAEDISFERWIYAGTWWFLKGRGELEHAVRGRPRSRDSTSSHNERDTSASLKQAYVNLAKALWITTEATTRHRELQKYGSGSMSSVLAIIKSFGDSRFAELVETHLAITTSLRALTMSMKRNNKMPTPDFEIQGLDSRVWLDTPRFAPGVASLISGASSRGLLENGPAESDVGFPIPVGDTARYYNFGSSFVDIILKSSTESQQEVYTSCILSILRRRTERDVEVAIVSQDGQINLVINSNKRHRPTWRDVHWQMDSHRILLRLSDSLDVDMQFSEHNYRSLWGIYDYTRRIRKSMESTDTEETVFKSTVRCVHYVDSPDAKVFPIEPVQLCDARLFAKSLTLAEGSGRRKFYSGHRLMVVTPPNSKNLCQFTQSLGQQNPIMFSYVRGDSNGPAMLIKNVTAGSTIVITFNDADEREHFHSQLNGTFMKHDEMCAVNVPLESMHMNDRTDHQNLTGKESVFSSWHWQDLRVTNKRPEYFENGIVKHVLSENLRVITQCEAGTFVDRMNLGKAAIRE